MTKTKAKVLIELFMRRFLAGELTEQQYRRYVEYLRSQVKTDYLDG